MKPIRLRWWLQDNITWRIKEPLWWWRRRQARKVYGPPEPFAHLYAKDAEILVYDRILDSDEEAEIRQYLASKWQQDGASIKRKYTPNNPSKEES